MADEVAAADPKARSRTADVVAVAILFAVITAVFADVWFQGRCFFLRDLTRYYYPTKRIVHDIVRDGELPLWNRRYSGGQPAAANPEYEVFYPGQWPIFLGDFYLGFRLHILLHFYVAALAMYSLMRSLRVRIAAAMATAIAFVLGGPLLSIANLLPAFFGIVWMPFTLLFARRFLNGRRRADFVIAALFAALQTLTFDPAVLPETLAVLVAYGLWIGKGPRGKALAAALAGAMFLTGVAVAAVQVIPVFELLRDTPRSSGLSFDAVSFWSMPPIRLVELLQPHFCGRSPFLSDDYWASAVYGRASTPFLQNLYLGYAFLVLLITGIVRRDRPTLAASAFAVCAWIAAFGGNTPLLRIALNAGIPTVVRFPERIALIAGVVLTIAAGLILDRVLSDAVYRRTFLRVSAVMAVVCIVISAFTFTPAYSGLFARGWDASGAPIMRHWIAVSRIDWLLTLARSVVMLVMLLAVRRMPARAVGAALGIFIALDLLQFTRELTPREARKFFEAPPVARELRQPAGGYRIFFEPEWSAGQTSRAYLSNAPTRFWTIRNGMFPRLPAAWGFSTIFERDIDVTNVAATDELTDAMWAVRRSGRADWAEAFAAMSNVDYRAAYRPFPAEVARHPDPKTVEPIAFVPVGPNPRYYFADEVVPVASVGDFVRRMTAERHSLRAAYLPVAPFTPAPASVIAVRESSNEAVLDVSAAGRALLVSSVTWHRNWRATIDGAPVAIHRTNVAYQSIDVPPGRHRVVFRYRDRAVVAGCVVSALALLACGFLLSSRNLRASQDSVEEIGSSWRNGSPR